MKTPITRASLQQHFRYHWWMYLIAVVASVFAWNLFFTVTEYRAPDEKKVDMYIASSGLDQTKLDAYMASVRTEKMPHVEETMSVMVLMDDYYGTMQMATYLAAGEGDIYILPSDKYRSYASSDAFLALDAACPELLEKAAAAGIIVDKGIATGEDGQKHCYGFPIARLTGLQEYGIDPSNLYLSIRANSANVDDVLIMVNALIDDMIP